MVGLGREFRQGGGRVHVPENLERARPCSLPYLQQQVVEYTYAACLYDHVRIGGASDHLAGGVYGRSEEHTSELQSLMRISYAVFCLKKKNETERISRHKKKQVKHNDNNKHRHTNIETLSTQRKRLQGKNNVQY